MIWVLISLLFTTSWHEHDDSLMYGQYSLLPCYCKSPLSLNLSDTITIWLKGLFIIMLSFKVNSHLQFTIKYRDLGELLVLMDTL